MTPLTPENYYSFGNRALTHSKIKDYATCPNYFYRKHVLGEIESNETDAFIFGAVVDKLLSGESFDTKYRIVERRTKALKEAAELAGETLILQSHYDEIIEVADAVEQTDAFQTIKRFAAAQVILQAQAKINEHFDCIAGRPDFYWIDDHGTCFIVDLKTAKTAEHKPYYYQALGYHYDSQLAMYKKLLEKLNPDIKQFRCFNLVAAKQRDVYKVELFEFDSVTIERAEEWLAEQIQSIEDETEYRKYNPSFDKPVIFGSFYDDTDAETSSIEDSEGSAE